MKLKLIQSVLLLAIYATGFAQVKETHITSGDVSVKYKLGGAIEKLPKEKTFKIITPSKLRYHNEEDNKKRWDWFSLNMDAKQVKADEQADKTFEIITDGLMPLNKYEDVKITTSPAPGAFPVTGWVRKVYFNFPIKIIVKDAAGKAEKEIVVSDPSTEKFAYFHSDVFTDDPGKRDGERSPGVYPSQEAVQKAFETTNKVALEKRLERNEALKAQKTIAATIYAGYDYNKFGKATLYYYTIKKSEKANYTTADQLAEKLATGMKDYEDEAKLASAQESLNAAYAGYKTQLDARDNTPADIIKLELFNGAIAALFAGNVADANKWFSEYQVGYRSNSTFGIESSNDDFYNKLYLVLMPYNSFKAQQGSMVNIDKPIGAYADRDAAQKAQAEAKRKEIADKNPNLIGAPGYIVLNNGQKLEGDITISFVQTPGDNIADLDLGSLITFQKKTGEMQSYKIRDVASFMAKDQFYVALEVKESAVVNVLGKITGDPNRFHFYKQYYKSGSYSVYTSPTDDSYYLIKKQGDAKALFSGDILKGRKPASDFIDACPVLKARVDAKDSFADIKDVKQLADYLDKTCN